jgi:hypothetical protein
MRMDASWSGPYGPTGYKVAARIPRAPTASSPRTRHPDHNERAAVLGSIKARPGNDGARGQRRATAGLDSPCARRLPTRVGRGEETGFQVEQRNRDEGSGECRQIVLDFEGLIQGLLRLHACYGPPDRSAAQRRPLSRGFDPDGCPTKSLVSYQFNRQFSGWNLPPLALRAFGAHCCRKRARLRRRRLIPADRDQQEIRR